MHAPARLGDLAQLVLHGADIEIQQPTGLAVSEDGRYVYVSAANTNGAWESPRTSPGDGVRGAVLVIDTTTNDVVKVIEIGAGPGFIGSRVVVPSTLR